MARRSRKLQAHRETYLWGIAVHTRNWKSQLYLVRQTWWCIVLASACQIAVHRAIFVVVNSTLRDRCCTVRIATHSVCSKLTFITSNCGSLIPHLFICVRYTQRMCKISGASCWYWVATCFPHLICLRAWIIFSKQFFPPPFSPFVIDMDLLESLESTTWILFSQL